MNLESLGKGWTPVRREGKGERGGCWGLWLLQERRTGRGLPGGVFLGAAVLAGIDCVCRLEQRAETAMMMMMIMMMDRR